MRTMVAMILGLAGALAHSACAEDLPEGRSPDVAAADAATDPGTCGSGGWLLPPVDGADGPSCTPLAGDYSPGDAGDGWAPCISDDGQYHPFDASISSVARVAAFEEIASLLLSGEPPSPAAFEAARVAYAQEQGIESRVSRREDEHYPPGPKPCADMTPAELDANRDRCVGPARIQPLLNAAFAAGQLGKDPLVNAARVEAGLLWFLYVSVHKEATTCAVARKDCDSAFAYYGGGEGRGGGLGLAKRFRALSPVVHDRAFDGVLAVRCWRDLDGSDQAADLVMRDRALAQLDRALLRGMALLVLSRLNAMEDVACDPGKAAAYWAGVQVLGGVLGREAGVRDPARAATLSAALAAATPSAAEVAAIRDAVTAIFPCP